MNIANQSKKFLEDKQNKGCVGYLSPDLAFSCILNDFIGDVTYVDITNRVLDFKDKSVLIIKTGYWVELGFYAQTQDNRC